MSFPKPKTYIYKVDETGCQIEADVYVPENITAPCPVIMWMHYSGMVFDNRNTIGTHMQYSATSRGYVLVNLDYRLAPQVKMEGIYKDVEDCADWVRNVLPGKLGEGIIDTDRLIVGGGSCGAQLALTAGLYMQPPPIALISLYALVDPIDPTFTTATKPNPPPGRDSLIEWSDVEQYLSANSKTVSHPETSLDIPKYSYSGRAAAYFYMLQEGTYLESVYGCLSPEEIAGEWCIPQNVTKQFPPTFVAHAQEDRFVPHSESVKLVDALKKSQVKHKFWSVPGNHDHGFDAWDLKAGEKGRFDQEFAGKLWPWLSEVLEKGN